MKRENALQNERQRNAMSERREGGIKWRRDQIGGDISCGAWEGRRKGEGRRWRIACVIYVLARGETLSDGGKRGNGKERTLR